MVLHGVGEVDGGESVVSDEVVGGSVVPDEVVGGSVVPDEVVGGSVGGGVM